MFVRHAAWCLACAAACSLPPPALAGETPSTTGIGVWPSRGYLGLNLGRSRYELSCGLPGFACDPHLPAAQLYGGYPLNKNLALELAASRRAQAVNLSLVGRKQLADSLGVYGHFGTTYGRADTSVLGAAAGADGGFGLSYGAGVSWALSRTASATLGWGSHELRLPGSGRDSVRSTNLGLQWRY
jgi:OmpA-OmpF porin, OOP family